jgi:hypothetical protein
MKDLYLPDRENCHSAGPLSTKSSRSGRHSMAGAGFTKTVDFTEE